MYAKQGLSQTAKDILAIADKVDELGWCQYASKDANGRVCIIGAGQELGIPLYDVFGHRIHPVHKSIQNRVRIDGFDYIDSWNDAKGRTKEQVLAMLRELAFNLDRESAKYEEPAK